MSDGSDLHSKYPHLLRDANDPESFRLVGKLDALSTAYQPSQRAVASIQRALSIHADERRRDTREAYNPRLLNRMTRRLSIGVAALVTATLLVSVSYAALPSLERAFNMQDGTRGIVSEDLGQVVDLRRNVGGYTVAIKRVYADASQVVIGYTVTGPKGRNLTSYTFSEPVLATADGTLLPWKGGAGGGVEAGTGGQVEVFDRTDVGQNAKLLRLQLRVPDIQAVEKVGGVSGGETSVQGAGVSATPVSLAGTDGFHLHTVRSGLRFDLVVPVEPRP
jgi:hypothetical protein